jgi:type VI protein secretion system component Hcp
VKTILCSLFALVAVSAPGFAQAISVSMTNGSTTLCTFNASSLLDGISVISGKLNQSPVTLVKPFDACSRTLLMDLFSRSAIPTVTISLTEDVAGASKTVIVVTLTMAKVTSLTDNSVQNGGAPTEVLQLTPATIKIFDVVDNTGITCSYSTGVCN